MNHRDRHPNSMAALPQTKRLFRGLPAVALVMCSLAMGMPALGSPGSSRADNGSYKRVLILNSWSSSFAWSNRVVSGVVSTFSDSDVPVEWVVEYMTPPGRTTDAEYLSRLRHLYIYKFSGSQFDAIISVDDLALRFLQRFHEDLFAGAPVVFCGVNQVEQTKQEYGTWCTGIFEKVEVSDTLEAALDIQPDPSKVAVLTGDAPAARKSASEIRKFIARENPSVRFQFFSTDDTAVWNTLIEEHEDYSFALLLDPELEDYHVLGTGNDALELAALGEEIPVYTCWNFLLNRGAVGGKVISGRRHGERAAQVALRVLAGEDPADIPVETAGPSSFVFDYTKMRRLNLSLSAIPSESTLVNAPSSFYSMNRRLIIAAVIVTCTLVGLVTLLVVHLLYRRRSEREFRKYEAYLLALVNATDDCAYLIDATGQILTINQPASRLLGRNVQTLEGASIFHVWPQDKGEANKALLSEARTSGTYVQREEIWDDHVFQTIISPVKENEGDITSFAIFHRDITDARTAEQALRSHADALERANQELQEFAYVASHDLQEPLRTIAGQLQLIQELYGDQLEPRMEKSINFAVDASKRMRVLISDLLAYSRVETQGGPPEPADSEEAIRIALTNLGVAISEAQADITYDALPRVLADPRQLVQLFQNLLENAIKFRGDDPPRVHVSAQRDEQEWIFSVADNGLGIDPKHSDRIFAIFKRLHGVGKYEGSGIGLAICKKIVERQNGRIWIQSQPGEGATFYFTLRDGGEQDDGKLGCATDRDPAGGRQPERCGPDGDGAHEGQGAE